MGLTIEGDGRPNPPSNGSSESQDVMKPKAKNFGRKKRAGTTIPRSYGHRATEYRIYSMWIEGDYFKPSTDSSKVPYTLIMPPPNVTGELHMGHALTTALEDLMTRWHRMRGHVTLYLPGTDHAGIATQVVVERMLAEEGITRHALGREKFVERVWEWVDKYGGLIYEQIKRLGASCDWSRQAFTLDQGPSLAVRTTFVSLYRKGLIYRRERVGNWCPRCATALSDLEVKHIKVSGAFYFIRYDLKGGDSVTIATTRPETLLGDTAVAVNPADERYRHLVGRSAVLPILGRDIPIIADDAVSSEFGTGALKVTPGHDPSDFEIGERHGLPTISILNKDGTLNEHAGPYEGKDRREARKQIVEDLDKEGLLVRTESYKHSVGHCDRCGDTVEPIVSKQWYIKMKPLAEPAIEAVRSGEIRIVPERFAKVYFNWMENIDDWCVSRQLWWGHRIPAWYCGDCEGITVQVEEPTTCAHCGSKDLLQDPDVLDTWFSSALWPHSTLGWPRVTEDLRSFYPTSDLETGHDILFFWVARMIMMGIENTAKVPFRTVYLHGLVRDRKGAKMSKSEGNVVDPLELIDQYGADALRLALTTGNSPGGDMRLSTARIEAGRNFANKLWNAGRFVLTNLDRDSNLDWQWPPQPFHLYDRWIISRLYGVVNEVQRHMHDYQFGEAQRAVQDFLWDEYCDWYLEMSKVRLRSEEPDTESPLPVMAYVFEELLRLLHPFMPFITEDIWQRLTPFLPPDTKRGKALIVSRYPEPDPALSDENAEAEVNSIIELIRKIRNVRAEFRINPNMPLEVAVVGDRIAPLSSAEAAVIRRLAGVGHLKVRRNSAAPSYEEVSVALTSGAVVIRLGSLVDLEREKTRLLEEILEIDGHIQTLKARVQDADFLKKAPEEVVARERERLKTQQARRSLVDEILSRLTGRPKNEQMSIE